MRTYRKYPQLFQLNFVTTGYAVFFTFKSMLNLVTSDRVKRMRLDRFRRKIPHVSQSALAAIIDAAHNNELPELGSTQQQRLARNEQMSLPTHYGPIEQVLELTPAPPYRTANIRIACPMAFLHAAVRNGGSFAEFLFARHEQTPSSPERPWGMFLYGDEVDPGLELAARHMRKTWAFYYSCWEFGPLP